MVGSGTSFQAWATFDSFSVGGCCGSLGWFRSFDYETRIFIIGYMKTRGMGREVYSWHNGKWSSNHKKRANRKRLPKSPPQSRLLATPNLIRIPHLIMASSADG